MKHTKLFVLLILVLASCAAPTTPAPTPSPTSTSTPEPTATQTPLPTPTIIPTPTPIGGGSGKLIFELDRAQFSKAFPELKGMVNVFIANTDGTNLMPITNGLKDYNYVENISEGGTKVLIDSSSKEFFADDRNTELYLINLTQSEVKPVKLGGGFLNHYGYDVQGKIARFFGETQVVYIGQGSGGYGIYIVNTDGTDQKSILSNALGVAPVEILSVDKEHIYWASATKDFLRNTALALWWSNIDGSGQSKFESKNAQIKAYTVAFSPDGTTIAWTNEFTGEDYRYYLNVAPVSGIDNPKKLEPLWPFLSLAWSPDNSRILVYDEQSIKMQEVMKYDSTSNVFGLYQVSNPSMSVKNEHDSDVWDILVPPESRGYGIYCPSWMGDFSPDGRHILVYLPNNDCERKVNLLDLETMTFSELLTDFTPLHVHWLP